MFGSWTSFETAISIIFDFLISDDELENEVSELNINLLKKITSIDEKSAIIEILKKNSFIPLQRKFNFITRRYRAHYAGNLKEDREFIKFAGILRNCMIHGNGIYNGSDYTYHFLDAKFIFKRNKIYRQEGNQEFIFFNISLKLKDIFTNLIKCTSDKPIILDI